MAHRRRQPSSFDTLLRNTSGSTPTSPDGYYDKRRLHFAVQARADLTRRTSVARCGKLLQGDDVGAWPFVDLPNSTGRSHWGTGIAAEDMTSFTWVKPRRVVEVSFVDWTRGRIAPSDVRRTAYR